MLGAVLGVKATHSKANRIAGCIRTCFRETTAGEADGSTGGGSCLLNGGNWDGLPKNAFEHGLEEALGACKGSTPGRGTSNGKAGSWGVFQRRAQGQGTCCRNRGLRWYS